MRDVEADGALHTRGGRQDDIACPTRQIKNAIGRPQASQLNQTPFPASILSVGEKPSNEVVAVSDGGKQQPNVMLFAFSGRYGLAQPHSRHHANH
jgi:hypothetical protein